MTAKEKEYNRFKQVCMIKNNAKQKAEELVSKYYKLAESIEWTDKETSVKAEKFNDELGTDVLRYWNELAKQSALVAVDQMMLVLPFTDKHKGLNEYAIYMQKYLEQIRHEIKKL